jgi:hypothetical protein
LTVAKFLIARSRCSGAAAASLKARKIYCE